METNCIFCQIISGKIPGKKVYENDVCLAVLDIKPANLGHVLLIPKKHYQIFPQIPKTERDEMVKAAKIISIAMLHAGAEGINTFIANGEPAGQKSPHMLMHIIPRTQDDGVGVFDELITAPQTEGCSICTEVENSDKQMIELHIEDGHAFIVPKKHLPIFEMLDDATTIGLMDLASNVSARFFQQGVAEGTNIITQSGGPAGQKVPHTGIHVIARKKGDSRNFEWKTKDVSEEELEKVKELYSDVIAHTAQKAEQDAKPEKTKEEPTKEKQSPEQPENYLLEQLKRVP